MRSMHLPPLPHPSGVVEGCWKLYQDRLAQGRMPFPGASQLLVAYMAWPNDEEQRNRWMATAIAFFVADHVETEPRTEPPTEYRSFELFGGLRAVADGALSYAMEKLIAIQKRWPRVADVL